VEPRLRFVGRKKELHELTAALACDTERFWLIAGPGGIGKSQLMKKFVCQVQKETNCVWLRGESEQSLKLSVISLCVRLGVSNQVTEDIATQNSIQHIVEHIRDSENKRLWVFIIDNIDEDHAEAGNVVTALIALSNIKIFATSRIRHIFGGSCVLLEVKPLSDEDAQSYVNNSLPTNQSPELVLDLCVTLQNHPLALSQAVDYIRSEQLSSTNEKYSIENYLNTFRFQSSKLLKHKVLDENTTVFHTCIISMKRIRKKHGEAGNVAVSFLRRLAYFDPDGVPRPVFKQFLSERTYTSQTVFDDGLDLLKRFSLIWIDSDIISVHRLVQHITKLQIQSQPRPYQYTNELYKASNLLLFRQVRDISVLKQMAIIFQHILQKQLELDIPVFNVFPFGCEFEEIIDGLKQSKPIRGQSLIRSLLYLVGRNTMKDWIPSWFTGTLERVSLQMEGNALEIDKLLMSLHYTYQNSLYEWLSIRTTNEKIFNYLHLIRVSQIIHEAKHPIQSRLREVKKEMLGVGEQINSLSLEINYSVFTTLFSSSAKRIVPT
jgi:energy-coupling factor transporter ATP-binding protein EcfA2